MYLKTQSLLASSYANLLPSLEAVVDPAFSFGLFVLALVVYVAAALVAGLLYLLILDLAGR